MIQLGKGGKDIGIPGLPHADAEVHIVEGHSKTLVQAVHLVVHALAHHQAGSGHGIDILRIDQTAHVAGVSHREVLVHVGGQGQVAKADACMLDGVVRVQQLDAHAAHALLLGIHDHLLEPARGDHLGIIVEQQQVFAGRFLGAKVVQGAVVEAGALPVQHPQVVRVLLLQLFVEAEGAVLLAVVLDDEDLKVRIGGLAVDGIHAGAQICPMVAAGDQDAHLAGLCDGVVGLVEARGVGDHGHVIHRHAHALVVGTQGLHGGFQTVHLGRNVACHAGGAGAPVIQQVRDVHHLFGLLGQAQVQVIILAAVELRPLVAAHLGQQRGTEHAQVADVVVGAEVVQHIIRLEVVHRQMVDVALKGDLVRIHEVGSLLGDGLCHIPQSTRMQDIVVVQQGHIVALDHSKALIGVAGNAVVLVQLPITDAGVGGGAGLHGLAHRLILPGVHHAQLPVAVALILHRVQQLHQELLRGVVQRHHDADERACRLVGRLLYQQLRGGKMVGGHGFAREQLFVLPLGLRLSHHAGDAHPAQRCQKDEQREGVPQLAALAHQIPHGPGELPELGLDHAVQRFFQVLLVAAAQRKVAAQALQLAALLFAGALGQLHALPQDVQFFLISGQLPGCIRGVRAAKQSRLQSAAPALPRKIAVQALLCQLLCAGGQHRFFAAHQQHPVGQLLRQGDPFRVHHHQKFRQSTLGRLHGTGRFQCTFQCADAAQHLYAAGAELPPDALCQLPAALRFIPGQFFLIQLHASFSIPWQTLLFSKRLMRTGRQRVSRRCVVLYHRNLSALR